MKKFVCTSLSAALVAFTVAPAFAQDYGFYDAHASRKDGASAMLDYRIPLDGKRAGKADYGFSLRYGPAARPLRDADGWKPEVKLADVRFSDHGMRQLRVGGYDFAQGGAGPDGDRLDMMEGKDSTTWIIIGLVVAGAVVWAVADDDDDEDDD